MSAPAQTHKALIKLLILGEAAVGKTSLLMRFTDPSWDPHSVPPTSGVDTIGFETQVDGRDVKLQLWDTAGQEKFRVITSTFYKGAHGVLAVYDVTSREAFETVSSWMGEVGRYCQGKVAKVVVANKIDLTDQRTVTKAEGEQLADSLGALPHVETSIFDAESVREAFLRVARLALAEYDAQQQAALAPRSPSMIGSPVALKPGTVFKVDDQKLSQSASPSAAAKPQQQQQQKERRGCCVLV